MAHCFWLICSGLFLFFASVASESQSNSTTENVTERSGREYYVHPPAPGITDGRVEVQSLAQRPKSLGTGTWKAIKIWNEPIGVSSSTTKRASSPERVVASSAFLRTEPFVWVLLIYPVSAIIMRLSELSSFNTAY